MKKCKGCGKEKEVDKFRFNKKYREGTCKKCALLRIKARQKTKEGKLKTIYNSQVAHSKIKNNKPPTYTRKEFVERYINDLDYLRHYYSWVISNYSKGLSPSFDRKDDYKGYSFDNIQIMYWFENKAKGHLDTKEGRNNKQSKAVIGTNIKTGRQIEFYSSHDAGRKGFNNCHISACCSGKRKTHKGFVWRFKNK